MNWALYMSLQDKPWITWGDAGQILATLLQVSLAILYCFMIFRRRKSHQPRGRVPDILRRKVRQTPQDRAAAIADALNGYEMVSRAAGPFSGMDPASKRVEVWDRQHETFLMPFLGAYTRSQHGDMYYSFDHRTLLSERVAHMLESLMDMDENTIVACNAIFDKVVKDGGAGTDVFDGTINYMRARVLLESDGEEMVR